MADPINYEQVLADLESRRAAFLQQIDAAIAGIRALLAPGTPGAGPSAPTGATANVPGASAYMGMGLLEAIKKHLKASMRPLTNPEIAAGLEAGGYVHNSTNFVNTVGTALWRAEKDDSSGIIKKGRTWLLKEWAPGYRRIVSSEGTDSAGPDLSGEDE